MRDGRVEGGEDRTLTADLATLAQNIVATALNPKHQFVLQTRPTNIQQKAFELLGINPDRCTQ
jgi:hypothetical protein